MGLRFDLRTVNWLAYVIDERLPVPRLGSEWEEREALRLFISQLRDRFYSSPWQVRKFEDLLNATDDYFRSGDGSPNQVLSGIRHFLGARPWTALLVPPGRNDAISHLLCSPDFLKDLIFIRPDDPGLVLQIESSPEQIFSLTNVFPAFRTALAASTEWPGVLLWTQGGDSMFFPLNASSEMELTTQARWIFSHLSTSVGIDLELLKTQYIREFADAVSVASNHLTILHLSDIHLGCREAGLRLPRVQNLLSGLVDDLGSSGDTVIPLISGDLMDSPDESNLDRVRAFLGFMTSLGTEPPIVLIGNHDVRRDGYLGEDLRAVMQISSRTSTVRWFEDFNLGIACFDSVRDGKFAQGYIGERQFLDIGSQLDEKCRGRHDYTIIAALHHHPIPVTIPDWYARPFHERVLAFEKTDELQDSSEFVDFAEERRFAAILHGHKHIPRIASTDGGIPVIGCGSTVGKVKTVDKRTFMSINLLTLNKANHKLSARLLAERIAGGGLGQYQSHEVVWSPQTAPTYRTSAP